MAIQAPLLDNGSRRCVTVQAVFWTGVVDIEQLDVVTHLAGGSINTNRPQ